MTTGQQGIAAGCPTAPTHATDVVELRLLLPVHQFDALEETAHRSKSTVAVLLRRLVSDYLRSPSAVNGSAARRSCPSVANEEPR